MWNSKRNVERVDYKALSNTGERKSKDTSSSSDDISKTKNSLESGSLTQESRSSELYKSFVELTSLFEDVSLNEIEIEKESLKMSEHSRKIIQQQSTLADDIDDFIEENPLQLIWSSIEDIDDCVERVEKLRTTYRNLHKGLKDDLGDSYEEKFSKVYERRIADIKIYFKEAKSKRAELRVKELGKKDIEENTKSRSIEFLVEEIYRTVSELEREFSENLTEIDNDEVIKRKNSHSETQRKVESLAIKFKELLKIPSSKIENIEEMKEEYRRLLEMKQTYTDNLHQELTVREIEKKASFNSAEINIKLPVFKGYNSELDIYTFQTTFEKLYSESTPKSLLADLLKNNFLGDPASILVKSVDNIREIWRRLKFAYGDPKTMLQRKLNEIGGDVEIWRIKDPEKLIEGLSKIVNIARDLMKLAKEHHIKSRLYNGDALERIYKMMGEVRVTRWLTYSCDEDLEDEELWKALIKFLEKEQRVQQQKFLICGKFNETTVKPRVEKKEERLPVRRQGAHLIETELDQRKEIESEVCQFCGQSDHVKTRGPYGDIIQYYSCEKFVKMNPYQRCEELRRLGFCIQCLFPGAKQNTGKHKEGKCQHDFSCKHPVHGRFPAKKHVLVCNEHRNMEANKKLLEEFRTKCILKNDELPSFSKNIQLSFHTATEMHSNTTTSYQQSSSHSQETAIYILQTIEVDKKKYTIFYDTGCSDLVCRYKAIKDIGMRATQECEGPITLGGVGNLRTESPHGIYQVQLPLHNGQTAVLSGVCLDQITTEFPKYPLQGQVEKDIRDEYEKQGKNPEDLPRLPKSVGGNTDFMIGAKYLRYYPEKIFQLPSGLTIYQSMFKNADNSRGVIGGPHQVFTKINQFFNTSCNYQQRDFISNQYQLYRMGYQVDPDVALLGIKVKKDYNKNLMLNTIEKSDSQRESYSQHLLASRNQKIFEEVENAGTDITFRCINCRDCKDCKNHETIESMSIREEIEQDIINKSVHVDIKQRVTVASLPLLHNPAIKLDKNFNTALKVYNQQVKKLSKIDQDKQDVIESEAKLQTLGHVDFVSNLSEDQQKRLQENPIQYHIPWRAVWKGNSLSTPCRIVFDASQATPSGFSLNDILAKGRNNMNKLIEIVIRWMTHKIAFHTDVQKMYNSVKLREEDWTLQRYLWQAELDPLKVPVEKVIKTLIYGVKPSGNQAERGLRETARLSKSEYPQVNAIIMNDVYVDDCISGESTVDGAMTRADELELVLNRGGFTLKGITFSKKDPPESLSDDGNSINVAGMTWYPKDDKLSLDISPLNFAKKHRGKKPTTEESCVIPKKLTRRHCVSKVAEVYDLTGKITPITASMKLDLHDLVRLNLDWDDAIPDSLRKIWETHFEMMQEIKDMRYNRAIVPDDATSLDINTIDIGDASKSMVCTAVYARFKRKNGTFSCQLVFARSKLVPEGMSQPRAELFAAVTNVHTGEVVKRAFGESHKYQATKNFNLSHTNFRARYMNSRTRRAP